MCEPRSVSADAHGGAACPRYFDGTTSGRLTSRLTNDVGMMMAPIQNTLSTLLYNLVMLFGGIAMCFYTSYVATENLHDLFLKQMNISQHTLLTLLYKLVMPFGGIAMCSYTSWHS